MYLIDANVLITEKNHHMSFDICPGFWSWLEQKHADQKCYSVGKVRDELRQKNDELKKWAMQIPKGFFIAPTSTTGAYTAQLVKWANGSHFTSVAIADFEDSADLLLVAQARELGYTVVTHETRDDLSKKRVKIPNACVELGVPWITPIEYFRAEGLKLISTP